jgi:PAS domain S-box-containing protein
MDLHHIISYPLYAGGALEIILGIALLKKAPRRDRAMQACAGLFFFAAAFVLCTAIQYTLEAQGRDFNFFNRACWIGWFMIPAGLQFAYYMQDENSPAARIVGYVLYPFWGLVFALTMLTDLVEPGDPSLIPFVDIDGPLERPIRIIGAIMAIWLLVELYREKNRMTGNRKAQFNLFFYGQLFFNLGCILVAGVLPLFGAVNPAFTAFFSLPWVVITYYAITRHRLFDLRLLVSRALNIAILSVLFSALHIVLFKLLSPSLGDSLAILLSLAVIGLVFFGTRFSRTVQQRVQKLVLQDKYDYQRVLRESIKALVTILNQDELLAYLIHSIKKSMGVESICLALKMEGGRLAQLYGDGALAQAKHDRPLSDEMIEWLRKANHVVVREELESTGPRDKGRMMHAYMSGSGAEIIVPLVYKGDLSGIMMLGRKGSQQPYVQSDIDLLELLAGHAAIAIENARLFDETRRTKESFLASEAKFRTLADTAAIAIFIHQGGKFLYANPAGEAIGGYTAAEYLGMDFFSLVHPDYVDMIKTRARERLAGGGPPPQYEFKIVRKNGEERWVLMTAGVMQYEGKPAVLGTLVDITARKLAEEERHRMSLLIENSSDYIAMSDMDGHMLFVNQAGRKLVGLDSGSDVRKLIADDFYFPEDLPLLRENRRRNDWRGEFRLRHFKTGAPIPIDWYIFNVTDKETGKPIARAAVMRDIADLKRAREERERYYEQLQATTHSLRESEEKFRSLAETAPAAIFIHQGSKFLYANPASLALSGYSREEFLALHFWDVTHRDDRDMIIERGRAHLSGDQGFTRYEFRIVTKKGEVRWVDMTVALIEYDGKPAVIGNVFDITARKQSEEERERLNRELRQALQSFRDSEAKFRTLAETTSAIIFIHRGGRGLYANPAGVAIAGYTNEEFRAMDFWSIIHPDHQELVKERGRARMRGEQLPPEYEFKIITKKGEERWVNMTVGMITYEGEPAVIGTLFDITARRQAEEETERLFNELAKATISLKESEAKFRTLAETTTAAIFIHQGQKLVYANSAGETMTGYTRDELLQEDFWALIHPDYQELVKERGQTRMHGDPARAPREYEFKFVRKDGEERWAATTAGIIDYGEKPAIIATLFDITDWKRAEEAKIKFYEESVRQYQERIEEEKRHRVEKEKILMDLHDGIGGITTNISILSALAQKATDREAVAKILATISRLSREGISEVRSFMHSLDSKELNWRTLAVELKNQGANMVEPHKIKFAIVTAIEDTQEQPGSLVWVNLFKIYKEALTNVIKHSKARTVNVEFCIARDGARLVIEDDGVGLNGGRTGGRGLSNMKTRAEEIGGNVTVIADRGTRIRVELPLPLKYPAQGMAI